MACSKRDEDVRKSAIYSVLGVFLGMVMCKAPREYTSLLFFVPLLWAIAPDRISAWLIVFMYYLFASMDIPRAAAVFFGRGGSLFKGTCLWVGSSLALSMPWHVLWKRKMDFRENCFRAFSAFFLVTVPPLGIIGWASPLMCAGWIFPRSGFAGLVGVVCAPSALAYLQRAVFHSMRRTLFLFCALAVCVYTGTLFRLDQSGVREDWAAINTGYGRPEQGIEAESGSVLRALEMSEKIRQSGSKNLVFPENIAGVWGKGGSMVWEKIAEELGKEGRTVVIGAEEYCPDMMYYNTARFLGHLGNVVYRQRFPVPVSMWLPWGGAGTAKARMVDSGLVCLSDGTTIACLICYEGFIACPVLVTMLAASRKPDLILSIENHWWASGTALSRVSGKSIESWARLFGVPYVVSGNYP